MNQKPRTRDNEVSCQQSRPRDRLRRASRASAGMRRLSLGVMNTSGRNSIERLQAWYAGECDGDWEHSYGVKIGPLDNPGWLVQIDLTGTSLSNVPFKAVERRASTHGHE